MLAYKQTLLLAALYDPGSGLVLWALDGAPKIGVGKTPMLAIASDYQESKNLDQAGNVLPNSVFRSFPLRAVRRPTVTWLLPRPRACAAGGLFVLAGASNGVRSVKFFDGKHLIATEKRGSEGLFTTPWRVRKARAGRHVLRALVTDRRGASASATRAVRVCH